MHKAAMLAMGMAMAMDVGGIMLFAAATLSSSHPLFLAPHSLPSFRTLKATSLRERMLRRPLYSACQIEVEEDESKRFLGSRRLALIRNGFRKRTIPLDSQVRILGSRRLAFVIRNLLKPEYNEVVKVNCTSWIAPQPQRLDDTVDDNIATGMEDQNSAQLLESQADRSRSWSLDGQHKFRQSREAIYNMSLPVFLEQVSNLEHVSSCNRVKEQLNSCTSEILLAWKSTTREMATKILVTHEFPSELRIATSDDSFFALSGRISYRQDVHDSCLLRYEFHVEHENSLMLNETTVEAVLNQSWVQIEQRAQLGADTPFQDKHYSNQSNHPTASSIPRDVKHRWKDNSQAMSVSRTLTVHAPSMTCFQIASDVQSYPE
eukprot:759214-Hanusia_phi.AAC.3